MKKTIQFTTSGTCSRLIQLTGEDGRVSDVQFVGGCHGNLQGIASLVKGMPYDDVIARLNGIRCGQKPSSCPDQLCRAIEELRRQEQA